MFEAGLRVSAIIPTYNRAELLAETLVAILGQDVPPYEVIVVDDGSDDDTPAVVASFEGKVRYVRTVNRGAPAARNMGASLAKGDWFWFCDSDDLWHKSYLDRALTLARAEPAIGLIFGNFRLVRDGDWQSMTKFETAPAGFWQAIRRIPLAGGFLLPDPLYEKLLRFQPVFHSTLLVSRALFTAAGGYDVRFGRLGSEDFEFVLRCAAFAPAAMIEDALVGIRRHAGNYSGGQLHNLLGEIAILDHARRHHGAAGTAAREIIADEMRERSRQALDLAFAAGDYLQVMALAQRLPPATLSPNARLKVVLASLPRLPRRLAVAVALRLSGLAQAVITGRAL